MSGETLERGSNQSAAEMYYLSPVKETGQEEWYCQAGAELNLMRWVKSQPTEAADWLLVEPEVELQRR